MRRAIIRQRSIVARAWERVDLAKNPRQAKSRAAAYYEARSELAKLRIVRWQVTQDARDRGRCPRCHKTISLSEAENYR